MTSRKMARNWVFTLNNPDALLDLDDIIKDWDVTYIIYSEEVGEIGTPHFQGYIQNKRSRALSWMKKIIPGAHFEAQLASSNEDARGYCYKPDDPTFIAGPYEAGKFRKKGERSDLAMVKKALDNGASDKQIADDHFGNWVRYNKAFSLYRQLSVPKRSTINDVVVIYGKPGLGKTYWATDYYKPIYWASRPNNGAYYFENYNGESTILADDFYGWWPRDFILRLCQPYECRLPYRGGEKECQATNIIFTSNRVPWEWYKERDIDNIIRRVTKWIFFTAFKTYTEFTDYNNFRAAVELVQPVCIVIN